jgi:hypothetical protein
MLDSHGPAATFGRLLEDDALAVFSVTVIRLLRFCREKRSLLTQAPQDLVYEFIHQIQLTRARRFGLLLA